MNPRLFPLVLIAVALTSPSCRRETPVDQPVSGPPEAGGLYSLSDGEGGYRAAKVVVADAAVIFVSLASDRWKKPPTAAQARQAATHLPVAYTPRTFTGMQPVLLEKGTPTDTELEAYETWKAGKREMF